MAASDTGTASEFMQAVIDAPNQVEKAFRAAKKVQNLPAYEKVQQVVVIGVGAAGIAGDVVNAVAGPFMPVPVTVVKSYELPAFVGDGSLVFALSYSGNTEETIDAASDAAVQGARVVVITCGGELGARASGWGAPYLRLSTFATPQSSMSAMAVSVLSMLEEVGLFVGASQWVDDAVLQLKERTTELQEPDNFAAQLADDLANRTLLIHAAGSLGMAAAQRWKTQFNVIAKTPAFWATQPDACHNEVAGWGKGQSSMGGDVILMNLRHDNEHPQMARRFELCDEYMEPHVGAIVEIEAAGDGELAQLLDLVLIGDYVALTLAHRNGLSGAPSEVLSHLKTAVAAC